MTASSRIHTFYEPVPPCTVPCKIGLQSLAPEHHPGGFQHKSCGLHGCSLSEVCELLPVANSLQTEKQKGTNPASPQTHWESVIIGFITPYLCVYWLSPTKRGYGLVESKSWIFPLADSCSCKSYEANQERHIWSERSPSSSIAPSFCSRKLPSYARLRQRHNPNMFDSFAFPHGFMSPFFFPLTPQWHTTPLSPMLTDSNTWL
jgi:hypothetical protein